MFVFKIAKLFLKLILGFVITAIITGIIISAASDWFKSGEMPTNNISYRVEMYKVCERSPIGTYLECPVCRNTYYKEPGHNCCSEKCERIYYELVADWNQTQNGNNRIEAYGFKAK